LADEIKESGLKTELIPLSNFFKEDYFDSKFVVYIPQ
jgi:16S rRNA (guanine527-N7)-methyltransferase